ncbi:hypothetical protein XO10_07020 [Marinitoga sp. 1135]|uniref:histidine kinase n=1 Tax=Marinitoga piezophila (strain DSM 14283 / JCM 11233 / KA3) TaxID=443254 RepID=H2J3S9_MARPK|nr:MULTISPECIES: hybrid sensor histidine kinase/response regulator [Marinitoga]AEX85821.1 histidine kinase,Response regulator receiver domain protein,histidine kinase [Marinitoga piezophila KA3]NUU96025.1 hypothetical protein [Marinitoga sp. 1135]
MLNKKRNFIEYFNYIIIFTFIIFAIISIIIIKTTTSALKENELEKQEKLMDLTEYNVKTLIDQWMNVIKVDLYTTPDYINIKLFHLEYIKGAYSFDEHYKIKNILKQGSEHLKKDFSVKYYKNTCQNMVVGEYRVLPFVFSPLSSSPEISAIVKYDNNLYYIFIFDNEFIKSEILKFVPEKTYIIFTMNKNVVFLNNSPYEIRIINNKEELKQFFGANAVISSKKLDFFSGNIYFITPFEKFSNSLFYLKLSFLIILLMLIIIFIIIHTLERSFIHEMKQITQWGRNWNPGDIILQKETHFNENHLINNAFIALMNNVNTTLKQLKETQFELMQSQKMETMGLMAGGFAHDFNNILTVLKTEVELMKYTDDPEEINESLENIEESIKRASNIIKQMLVFSKKGDVNFETFNFNEFINNTYKLLRKGIPLNIKLSINNNIDNNVKIFGDQNQLTQVLLNLITNARDAVKNVEKPEIIINISTEIIENNNFIKLQIIDNGTGIPEENIKKIFDPFYTTKGKKGTGLGLAIVNKIISDHNGKIEVSSSPNKGSIFSIYLPTTTDKIIFNEMDIIYETTNLKGKNILIVDDEIGIRKNLKKQFEKMGATVYTAHCVKNGIELYEKFKDIIDIVITDYMMPEETGDKLVEYIRRYNPDVKIVVITGYLSDEVREKLEKFNVLILNKPFEFAELITAITR